MNELRVYDLEERTAAFGESIVDFAKTIPLGPITNRLVDQLIGAGTSVGANYCEAETQFPRKTFDIELVFARKKHGKRSSSSE